MTSWRQVPRRRSAAQVRLGTRWVRPVSAVLGGVVGIVMVVTPWLLARLARSDPGDSRPGWLRRVHRTTRGDSASSTEPSLRPLGATRLAAAVALAVALGLVASWGPGSSLLARLQVGDDQPNPFRLDQGAVRAASDDDLPPLEHPVDEQLAAMEPDGDAVPAALAGQPWVTGRFQIVQAMSFQVSAIRRPTQIYPVLDFTADGLSVRGGLRSTWRPPPCACPTVRLWMYGGSTTYGLNQRDDHTIASELARIAHHNGLRLEVDNRGVLGYLHWMEAERFAYDLSVDEHPEFVLFYDGVNETWATNLLNNRRSGDIRFPVDATAVDIWGQTGRSEQDPPPAPPGARLIGWDQGVEMGVRETARVTVARYDRSRSITRGLARHHDIRPIYAWQPTRASRALVPGEPHGDAATETYVRLRDQLQREYLPHDVTDLVDVFDDIQEPLFTDDVHHNELGARLVAEAIYAKIGGELRAAAGSGELGS